jgi:hypothetical protein
VKGNVAWVDEDEKIWAAERRALVGLGYVVYPIGDATTALEFFQADTGAQLSIIILDVMLLQGDHHKFSDDVTDNGLNTGIILTREILILRPNLSNKIVWFSRASQDGHIAWIKKHAEELHVRYIQKGPETQGRHFIKWLIDSKLIDPPPSPKMR